jgi:chemotaxis protein CheX
MELTDDDVHALVQEIWESVLQLEVVPTGMAGPHTPGEAPATLSAFIHIHGTWEGTVVVQASTALADQVASAMFMMPAEELTADETGDALGEVVNMLGGSVKSMVEGEASLSLPLVIGVAHYTVAIPGSHALNEVWFACGDQPLVVRVFERVSAQLPGELSPAAVGGGR